MKLFIISTLLLSLVLSSHLRELSETVYTCYYGPCLAGEACDIYNFCAKICTGHADCNNPNMVCDDRTTPTTCKTKNCTSDSQCVGPSTCHPNQHACNVLPGVCTSDAQCVSGEICDLASGNCLTSCGSSEDCISGQICGILGGCVNKTIHCRTNADCGIDQMCNTLKQVCIPLPKRCHYNSDCDYNKGQVCHYFQGYCRRPCESNLDCFYPNSFCEFSYLHNVCSSRRCSFDSDCIGASTCNGYICSRQLIPCPGNPQEMCLPNY